jgi:hypothetical protein
MVFGKTQQLRNRRLGVRFQLPNLLRMQQVDDEQAMSSSDYCLPLRWRYTIAITATKSAAIVPIASNPGDFVAGAGGGVVGWSFTVGVIIDI